VEAPIFVEHFSSGLLALIGSNSHQRASISLDLIVRMDFVIGSGFAALLRQEVLLLVLLLLSGFAALLRQEVLLLLVLLLLSGFAALLRQEVLLLLVLLLLSGFAALLRQEVLLLMLLLLSGFAAVSDQLLLPLLQKMSHSLRLARTISAMLQTVSQKLSK
jgi:hypothetical protein